MPGPDRCLWLLPEPAADAFTARLGGPALLSAEEQAEWARKRTGAARRRYLAARLLARHALTAASGWPLSAWRFRRTEHGRPEPEPGGHGLRFNLSHTDGLIACVVTGHGRACGVDVERSPAGPDAVTYLPPHFAAEERADLAAAGPDQRADRVAAYWVLKEAYAKALGTGLRSALSTYAFTGLADGLIRLRDGGRPASGGRWQFDLIRPGPGHVLAVAAEHAAPDGLRTVTVTG
ncbi:4'-phosphopantetheinyl transferase superfamily protein [Streptomyces sp. NPDC052682]|uniref:4'-phosphopantetheinyl transferase family protein n=1 Tax=Streptomyces sp. NPDC052682 TaxID=3154954 RepID=UPI0034168B93